VNAKHKLEDLGVGEKCVRGCEKEDGLVGLWDL
jgi:hypothetical protein